MQELNRLIVGRRTSEKKKYHLKSQMPDEKIRSYLRHRKRKKYLSESDSEIQDQISTNLNSTRTMFLARSQQRSLKPQKDTEPLKCEIRTLTDH